MGPIMSALTRAALLLLVGLLVVLPLYELIDIGEQWPNDGIVVTLILSALFLIGLSIVCRGLAQVCTIPLRRMLRARLDRAAVIASGFAPPSRPALPFLFFCLLRI